MSQRAPSNVHRLPPRPRKMGDERLIAVLRRSGCPLCTYQDQVGRRALETMMDEQVNDVDGRRRFLAGGGFCPAHVHLALEVERQQSGGQTGSAILFRAMLGLRLEQLQRATREPRRTAQIIQAVAAPAAACPSCEQEQDALRDAMTRFLEAAESDDLWSHWVFQAPYCLPHLASLVQSGAAGATAPARLVEAQLERLGELRDRLESFVHNASADRIEEQTDAERAAAGEAAAILGGDRRRRT